MTPRSIAPAPSGCNTLGGPEPCGDESLAGLRILVVDDDPDMRSLEKLLFSRAGAIVVEAPSARVAFDTLREFQPHLLVSDIHMPDEDGYGLMRRIRALAAEVGGSIPAIALTGGSDGEERRQAFLAGFSAHLAKPVNANELLATVLTVSGLSAH